MFALCHSSDTLYLAFAADQKFVLKADNKIAEVEFIPCYSGFGNHMPLGYCQMLSSLVKNSLCVTKLYAVCISIDFRVRGIETWRRKSVHIRGAREKKENPEHNHRNSNLAQISLL